jgi:hypothetical protein
LAILAMISVFPTMKPVRDPQALNTLEKIRHSFFNADKSGVVNCVSASAVAQPIESPIKRQQ